MTKPNEEGRRYARPAAVQTGYPPLSTMIIYRTDNNTSIDRNNPSPLLPPGQKRLSHQESGSNAWINDYEVVDQFGSLSSLGLSPIRATNQQRAQLLPANHSQANNEAQNHHMYRHLQSGAENLAINGNTDGSLQNGSAPPQLVDVLDLRVRRRSQSASSTSIREFYPESPNDDREGNRSADNSGMLNRSTNPHKVRPQTHHDSRPRDRRDYRLRERHDCRPRERDDSRPRDREDSRPRDSHGSRPRDRNDSLLRDRNDSLLQNRNDSRRRDRYDSRSKDRHGSLFRDRYDANPRDRYDSRSEDRHEYRLRDRNDSKSQDRHDPRPRDRLDYRPPNHPDYRPRDHYDSCPGDRHNSRNRDHNDYRRPDHNDSRRRDHNDSRLRDHNDSRRRDHNDSRRRDHNDSRRRDHNDSRRRDHNASLLRARHGSRNENHHDSIPRDRHDFRSEDKTIYCQSEGETSRKESNSGHRAGRWVQSRERGRSNAQVPHERTAKARGKQLTEGQQIFGALSTIFRKFGAKN